MAKNEHTSQKVASKASKLLTNPNTPKAVKSVAGSALTQARNKPTSKRQLLVCLLRGGGAVYGRLVADVSPKEETIMGREVHKDGSYTDRDGRGNSKTYDRDGNLREDSRRENHVPFTDWFGKDQVTYDKDGNMINYQSFVNDDD